MIAIDIPANCVIKGFSYKTMKNINTEEEYAVVDIGHYTTMVCIFQNNRLKFSRILLNASADIDRLIANQFNLEYSKAEEMKISFKGTSAAELEAATTSDSELVNVIEKAMSNIVADINRFIEFYNSRENSKHVQRIFICGGGSKLTALSEYFSSYLNIPVSPLPFGNEIIYRGKKDKKVFEEDYISLVTAIGGLVRK